MKIAFVFPGQGSQSVGMMAGFDGHPAIRSTFDEASEVLGQDLWALVSSGPEADLNQTVNTQPVMLTVGVAVWRAWNDAGGAAPVCVAGHSLGEYTALVAAGAIAFRDAVPLVRFRAEAMQDAVAPGEGAMAAIMGGDDEAIVAACREAAQGEVVEAVNYNSPGQLVIAGDTAAVERAVEGCKRRGAKRALVLAVSVPAHSSLLKAAGARLAGKLAETPIRTPRLEVYAIGLKRHDSPQAIRANLVEQLSQPVRWSQTVAELVRRGATRIVECGPGKVLTGLNRRIERNKAIAMLAVEDPDSLASALQEVSA